MIGQRYVAGTHAEVVGGESRPAPRTRARIVPAIAGRERLLDALGHSVLVQLMLAMTLVALAAMIYLAQASQASVVSVNIDRLQVESSRLQVQSVNLSSVATQLQSLGRIEPIASTQLKMRRADLSTTVWIKPHNPQLPSIISQSADTVAAQKRSQPLAWIVRFGHTLKALL